MDDGRFIWCRNCGAIHHVSAFDRSPVYLIAAGEVHEKQSSAAPSFLRKVLEPIQLITSEAYPPLE